MSTPQTIQIFLPDGSPTSIKIAEITNRVVKAVLVPKTKVEYIASRSELNNVGIYFLIGETEETAQSRVYIGEAENCLSRIKQHGLSKEFWQFAVVMISKINAFTKTHVKFLEYLAIQDAQKSSQYRLENQFYPNKPFVTEPMQADLLDSFGTMKILLTTLGFPIYDSITKEAPPLKNCLRIRQRKIEAHGDLVDEGFVVYKHSQVKKEVVPSCSPYLIKLRTKLIQEKIIVPKGEVYVFAQNYLFKSPSTAGGVVVGRNTNGWTSWKNSFGVTLHKINENIIQPTHQ